MELLRSSGREKKKKKKTHAEGKEKGECPLFCPLTLIRNPVKANVSLKLFLSQKLLRDLVKLL